MDNEGYRSTFWRGAFLGLIIGALIAMLSTPKTGGEMRSAVRDKAGKAKTKVVEWRRKPEQQAEEM